MWKDSINFLNSGNLRVQWVLSASVKRKGLQCEIAALQLLSELLID